MPYNGSGSFNLVYNWQSDAANGLNISSSRMQGQDSDIAAGLSLCLTKDGQQQAAANLPMGGFTLTNMANASAQKQPISVQDFQNGTPTWLGTVTGTDTITGAANIAPSAYAKGQRFRGVTAGTNTTNTVTLNVNGLGAKPVVKNGSVALAIGDLAAGQVFEVTYDGTNFQISGSTGGRGSLLNIQKITATGTYTPTPGANSAIVYGSGSGGAAGAVPTTTAGQSSGSAGGSAGAFGCIYIASGLSSQAATIGAAGAGTSGTGGAGATCSFGALMVLPGGPGGGAGSATGTLTPSTPGAASGAPSGTGNFLFSSNGPSGSPGFSGAPIGGQPGFNMFGAYGLGAGGPGGAIGPNTPGANGAPGNTGGFIVFEYA
ncbi:hypothetical protein [Paraburkholderia phenoliruptrix]|uniref:hypothetical protein n=1 Tax=Paraburkholderia phenoliruptrix TaxID=252970 RepID=UPI002860022D|nr:hypothetical protein [Paraburkholderia phenoliruptrix]MDR6393064.1 hypothetical protein [Paraburkholderia phenoliruptrix]